MYLPGIQIRIFVETFPIFDVMVMGALFMTKPSPVKTLSNVHLTHAWGYLQICYKKHIYTCMVYTGNTHTFIYKAIYTHTHTHTHTVQTPHTHNNDNNNFDSVSCI